MAEITQVEITNRFPRCIWMKLHLKASPLASDQSFLARLVTTKVMSSPQDLDLSLTIGFTSEQEIEVPAGRKLGLPGGRARFGIHRGELQFDCYNCKFPLEGIALSKPFEVYMDVEQQQTHTRETQATIKLNELNLGTKQTEECLKNVTMKFFQVKPSSFEEQRPAWVFNAYGKQNVLDGLLKETLLGSLNIDQLPCTLTLTFTARGEDIRITWGQLGLTKDIHRNKLAVIERAIVLHYLKPLLEAKPLSEGSWHYG